MPTYRYDCGCPNGLEIICSIADMLAFESEERKCKDCDQTLVRSYRARKHISFRAGVYENIGEDPIQINSAQQLVDECRKRDNSSVYMKDMGGMFGAKENRWV
jgi:hypothetical protein